MPVILLSWVIVGLFGGLCIYLFSPRRPLGGAPVCMLVGLVGAAVAGYMTTTDLRVDIAKGSLTYGILITSFIGAVVAGIVWTIATKPAPTVPE